MAEAEEDDTETRESRSLDRSHSDRGRTPSNAPSLHSVHTVVHRYEGRRRKKQTKKQRAAENKKKENRQKQLEKMPLEALKQQVQKREKQAAVSKEASERHNAAIDEQYEKLVLQVIEQNNLTKYYKEEFDQFEALRKTRTAAFNKMQDVTEDERKRFNEYWRRAKAKRLQDFLTKYHVPMVRSRGAIAKAYHEAHKESLAKIAADNAAKIAALAAAQTHISKEMHSASATPHSMQDPGTEETLTNLAPMSYDSKALWGESRAR